MSHAKTMIEQLTDKIFGRLMSAVRAEDRAANTRFSVATNFRDDDDQHRTLAARAALEQIERIAHRKSIPLLPLEAARDSELMQLPLREIESRLGISSDDEVFGRTAYVHRFRRSKVESEAEAAARQDRFSKLSARLRSVVPS
jgi:hypothetical protein